LFLGKFRRIDLINKQKTNGSPKVAALWFGVSIYLNSALLLLATPVFTRIMSPAEYGEVTLYNSWFALIGVFSTLSLYAGVFNSALLKFEGNIRQLMGSMLVLVSLCSVLVWVVLTLALVYFGNFTGVRPTLLIFMAFSILANAVYMFWRASERFVFRYQAVTKVSVTASLIGVGGTVALMVLLNDSQHKVELRVIGAVLPMLLVGGWLFVHNVRGWKISNSQIYWGYGLSMGLPLIPHYLAQGFLLHFDKFAVEHYLGKDSVGIYGLAFAVTSGLTLFWTAINTTWVPWMLRKYRDSHIDEIRRVAPYLINTVAALALVGGLFSPEAVNLLAPGTYRSASTLIPMLLVASLLQFIQSIYLTVQFQERKVWTITLVSLCSALFSITMNFWLLPIIGLLSVAVVMLAAQCLQLVMQYSFSSFKIRSVVSLWNILFLIAVGTALALLQTYIDYEYRAIRLSLSAFVIFVLGIYVWPMLRGGGYDEEK